MDQLIREEILDIKEMPLSPAELGALKAARSGKYYYWLGAYLGLTGVIVFVTLELILAPVMPDRYGQTHARLDEGFALVRRVAPMLIIPLFFLLLLNIYFYFFYKRTIAPLKQDIKKGTKLILFLKPEKREPFFGRYFIILPLQKNRQLELSGEDYYKLKENAVKLVIAPHSFKIIELLNGDDSIEFFEHNKG